MIQDLICHSWQKIASNRFQENSIFLLSTKTKREMSWSYHRIHISCTERLTRDTENSMCGIFTRWIFFLKQVYTLLSKTYFFENHKLKSCHISLQAQSCFFVVFSIPSHPRWADKRSSCNQNKYNQHKHIFHDTLISSVITRPCGNKPFYNAFIQGLSFPNCGEYLICFLTCTLCN